MTNLPLPHFSLLVPYEFWKEIDQNKRSEIAHKINFFFFFTEDDFLELPIEGINYSQAEELFIEHFKTWIQQRGNFEVFQLSDQIIEVIPYYCNF
jgi:hypothetical protein